MIGSRLISGHYILLLYSDWIFPPYIYLIYQKGHKVLVLGLFIVKKVPSLWRVYEYFLSKQFHPFWLVYDWFIVQTVSSIVGSFLTNLLSKKFHTLLDYLWMIYCPNGFIHFWMVCEWFIVQRLSSTLRWFMNGLLPKRFHPLLDGLYSTMTAAAALRTFLCRENPPNIQQHHRPTPSSCFFFQKQIGKTKWKR